MSGHRRLYDSRLGAWFALRKYVPALPFMPTGSGCYCYLRIASQLGVVFMFLVDWLLGDHDLEFHHLRGATARKALLILAAMTFHSVAEGIAIGVSFSGQGNLGFVISSALGVHNVPEGLTVRV